MEISIDCYSMPSFSKCVVNVGSNDRPRATYAVNKLFIHSDYDPMQSINNIGLIYLKENISFDKYISPI